MKRLALLLLIALFVILAGAQTTTQSDEEQVREIPQRWMDAYNQKDAAAVSALYADDAYYVSQHVRGGYIQGRGAIKANAQRGIDGGGHVDAVELLTVSVSGDTAYSVGTYHATNAGVNVTGRNIVVLKKINGKWLIVAHTSVVPDQP